jgi:hypothetical protein
MVAVVQDLGESDMTIDRRTFVLAGAASAVAMAPAGAQRVTKFAEQLQNGEFNWYPERAADGPILIIVSIPEQKLYVYRGGVRIAASTCSTGKTGHATPTGVFTILQKDRHHHSSTYNNAPMPNMNRLTWSGIALHAGNLPGYPASHGCVRLPLEFSALLFGITKLGMTVVIADGKSFPATVVHPTLFLDPSVEARYEAVAPTITAAADTHARTGAATTTAVVVSAKDKTARVVRDGQEVASGPVTIDRPDDPIGDMIYHLSDHDAGKKAIVWSAAATNGGAASEVDADVLRRIRLDDAVLSAAAEGAHEGMTLVTTDGSHGPANRSDPGFAVLTSDNV